MAIERGKWVRKCDIMEQLNYAYSTLGSHRARSGKAMSITTISSMGIKKGREPAAIVNTEYLGMTLCMVNRFKPNGGVTNPTSASIT